MRFFLAKSKTWISFVTFLTIASDSDAFSCMRDIWPSSSCVVAASRHLEKPPTRRGPYRDHFLDHLHPIRVLIRLQLFGQFVNLRFHLPFVISQTLLNSLKFAEGCLWDHKSLFPGQYRRVCLHRRLCVVTNRWGTAGSRSSRCRTDRRHRRKCLHRYRAGGRGCVEGKG